MKKALLYGLILFAAFHFLGAKIGALVTIAFIIYLLYSRRAVLLTQMASQAYYVKGNTQKAEKLFKKAYKTGIMPASCKTTYSAFCLRENQFDKGKRLLNEVINSSRTSETERENAKHNLAILVWKEGNLDEAISIMEEVHKAVPATNTYGSLGVLYLEKAKRDECGRDFLNFMLEAYEYNENDKTIADNLGELYYIIGELEKAKEVYSKLLSSELFTPMPYYNYARVLKELGDIEGAKENLEFALTRRFTSVLTVTKEMIQEEIDKLN